MQCKTNAFIVVVLAILIPLATEADTVLVVNREDSSVTLLRSPGFEPIVSLPTGKAPHEIALAPEGLRALISNYGTDDEPGNTLTLIDFRKLRTVATIKLPVDSRPHGIAWPRPDTAIVTAEGINALLIIDMKTYQVRKRLPMHNEGAHMLVASRSGRQAWVSSRGSGTLTCVDLLSETLTDQVDIGVGAESVVLANNEQNIWVSNRQDGSIVILDATTLERLKTIRLSGLPVRLSPDERNSRVYATLAANDQMAVFDMLSYDRLKIINFDIAASDANADKNIVEGLPGSIPYGVLAARDGKKIFVVHMRPEVISVLNGPSLRLVDQFKAGRGPDGMTWTWFDLPM
ncbi:MAG: YncE family protein [Parahaliea sp.]